MTTLLFNYHVYNRQGQCLAGVDLPEGKTVEEVVTAFVETRGTTVVFPPTWDEATGCYWFGERRGTKDYNRYVVPACGAPWVSQPPVFKRGTLFRHGKWLEPDTRDKAICRVTAIRHGQVYYGFGPDARHGSYYKTAEGLLADGAEVLS